MRAGITHYLTPFFDIFPKYIGELFRGSHIGSGAGGCKALFDFLFGQDFVDIAVHLLDDVFGCTGRHEQAKPWVHVEVGITTFCDGGDAIETFDPFIARESNGSELARIDMTRDRGQTGKDQVDFPPSNR